MARNDKSRVASQIAAFLTDGESEEIAKVVMGDIGIEDALVKRGAIDVAISYLVSNASPKIVIVDVSRSDLPLSDVNALADACEPGTEVIVIGQHNDIGLFRDLMTLGVSDYLVKPLTRDLLRRAVDKVRIGQSASSARGRTGKIVTVTGVRGGAGTTTIAANLGWILSQKVGRRVSLIDLDFSYGALSLALDQKASPGLREALENVHRVDGLFLERTLVKVNSRLSMLSCEEPLDYELKFEPRAFDQLTEHLAKQFHYVVIDAPRAAGIMHLHVLRSSHVRILVIDPTLSSVRHTIRLFKTLGTDDMGRQTIVVLNRRWAPTDYDLTMEEIEKALGRPVDVEIPHVKAALIQAENSGEVIAAKSTVFSEGLEQIVQELSGKPRVKTTFLQRLMRNATKAIGAGGVEGEVTRNPPKISFSGLSIPSLIKTAPKPEAPLSEAPAGEPSFADTFGPDGNSRK